MIVRHNDLFYTGIAYRNPQQRPFGNSIVILSLFKQPFPPGKYWISIEILDDIRQRDQIIELKEIEFSRCCICDTDFFFSSRPIDVLKRKGLWKRIRIQRKVYGETGQASLFGLLFLFPKNVIWKLFQKKNKLKFEKMSHGIQICLQNSYRFITSNELTNKISV